MKLFKMAYRNVRKYYRHYTIVAIIVLFGTVFLLSSVMIKESKANTKNAYNQNKYGSWYVMMSKDEMDSLLDQSYDYYNSTTGEYETKTVREQWDNKCELEKNYEYTYVYEQGYLGDALYGYINPDHYDLFSIHIIDGSERADSNDLLVEETYAKENHLSIGDHIDIQLDGVESSYIITGIFTNYNDNLPVILTNNQSGTGFYYSNNSVVTYDMGFKNYNFVYATYIGDELVHTTVALNYTVNSHGSDGKESTSTSSLTYSRLQSFYQMIVLLAIVISVLTTTSLKRRAKESSLLRGIGATTGQLIKLTIDEMSIVLFFTTILGVIISYIILRVYGHMMTSTYGFYLYDFSKLVIFLYCIGISIVIIFITFLPMRSAAIGALTGAFEQPKHKMLEGRESKWVSQTSHVMAKRQLRGYSKLSLFLMLFVTFIGIYFITYRAQLNDENSTVEDTTNSLYKNKLYTTETFDNIEDSNTYLSFFNEEDTAYTLQQKQVSTNSNGTLTKYNEDFISLFTFNDGSLPTSSNEVLVTNDCKVEDLQVSIQDVTFKNDSIIKVNHQAYLDFYEYDGYTYYRSSNEESYQKIETENTAYYGEYVMIDGIIYIPNRVDIEDGVITAYVLDENDNEIAYSSKDHQIEHISDMYIGIIVGNKLYTDSYTEDGRGYYKQDGQSDYSTTNNFEQATSYLTYHGESYLNYKPVFTDGELTGFYLLKDCNVGDSITINEQEYTISGIISSKLAVEHSMHPMWHESTTIYSNNNIYLLEDAYNSIEENEVYTSYVVFNNNERDSIIYNLYNYFGLENQAMTEINNTSTNSTASTTILNTSAFNGPYLLIVIGLGIILCIGLNINNMLNDIKNYAVLHLLGMTREDIVKMHFHMALVMSERVLAIIGAYYFFLYIGFRYSIDILSVVILVAGILFFFICAYVFPVMYILKGDLMESLMAEE